MTKGELLILVEEFINQDEESDTFDDSTYGFLDNKGLLDKMSDNECEQFEELVNQRMEI